MASITKMRKVFPSRAAADLARRITEIGTPRRFRTPLSSGMVQMYHKQAELINPVLSVGLRGSDYSSEVLDSTLTKFRLVVRVGPRELGCPPAACSIYSSGRGLPWLYVLFGCLRP